MSALPIKYRVRLAYGFWPVGHVFVSPPMSRGEAQILARRGFLEEVKEDVQQRIVDQAHATLDKFLSKSKQSKRK